MDDLRTVVKKKIEEVSFAEYSGQIKGVLIIAIDDKNNPIIYQGYDSTQLFVMNLALDMAKQELIDIVKTNMGPAKPKE